MKELISLFSNLINGGKAVPEYTIGVGGKVAIIGAEILTHPIVPGSLGTVNGFLKYPMVIAPTLSNEPLITHAEVHLQSLEGGTLSFAIPLTQLRNPNFIEATMGKQTPESYVSYMGNRPLHEQLLPESLNKVANSIRNALYGVADGKIYALTTKLSQEESREFHNPAVDMATKVYDALQKLPNGAGGNGSVVETPVAVAVDPEPVVAEAPKAESKIPSALPIMTWDEGEDESYSQTIKLGRGRVDTGNMPKEEPIVKLPVEPVVDLTPEEVSAILPVTERIIAAAPAASNVPKTNPNFVPATKEELLQRAMQNIGMLDREAGLEDLEGAGARVQVDDKAMINCRADLNQLVPFKYEYMWQAYLKGTENHWMPLEIPLEKDASDWAECTPDESKLIQYACYTLETHTHFYTNDPLLAIYRFITNPEARQYILRQRFEITVWGNFIHNVMDHFNYQFPITHQETSKGKVIEQCDWYSFNDKSYKSFLQRDQIATKLARRKQIVQHVGQPDFEPTDSVEDKTSIVERTLAHYICYGFIYNYASLIQLIGLKGLNKFPGLVKGAEGILRDVALQTSAGILIIRQILLENADIATPEVFAKLVEMVRLHCDTEIEYIDWWANSDVPNAKTADQIQTLKYMVNRFSEEIGIGRIYEDELRTANCPWFVAMFDAYTPNLHGGGSSVLGSGGALSF